MNVLRCTVLLSALTIAIQPVRAEIKVEGCFLENLHVSFDHEVDPGDGYTKLQVVRWVDGSGTTNVLHSGGLSVLGKLRDPGIASTETNFVFYGIRGVRGDGGSQLLSQDMAMVNPPKVWGTVLFDECVFYDGVQCHYVYSGAFLDAPLLMGNSYIAVGSLFSGPIAVNCQPASGVTAPQDQVDELVSSATEGSYWGGYGGPLPSGQVRYWLDNYGAERTTWAYLFNHPYRKTGTFRATPFPDADRPMPKLDVAGAQGGQNTLGNILPGHKMLARAGRDVLFCFDVRTNAERFEGVTYYLMIDDTVRLDPRNGGFVAKRDYGSAKASGNGQPSRTLNFVLPAADTDTASHKIELFADTQGITRFRDEGRVDMIWYSRFELNAGGFRPFSLSPRGTLGSRYHGSRLSGQMALHQYAVRNLCGGLHRHRLYPAACRPLRHCPRPTHCCG